MQNGVSPKVDWVRLSRRAHDRGGEQRIGTGASRGGAIWSARAAASARCDLGGDHPPWDRLAAWQLPGPRRGPDDGAEPAAADVPTVDADVDPSELIAARLPP